jgi:hypothetical protein
MAVPQPRRNISVVPHSNGNARHQLVADEARFVGDHMVGGPCVSNSGSTMKERNIDRRQRQLVEEVLKS